MRNEDTTRASTRAHAPASAAGLHLRLAAAAIDALVCVPMVFVAKLALDQLVPTTGLAPEQRVLLEIAFSSLPVLAFISAGETGRHGGTLGKRVLGLRVVEVYGSRLSVARAVSRACAKVAPWQLLAFALLYPHSVLGPEPIGLRPWMFIAYGVLGLYLAAAMLTLKKQGVHDLATGTYVIQSTD